MAARACGLTRAVLLGDGVACTVVGLRLPEGHKHIDRMHQARVGRCRDARGLREIAAQVDPASLDLRARHDPVGELESDDLP